MDCPRCGVPAVVTAECPRCGVVLAKARARAGVGPRKTAPAGEADPQGRAGRSARSWSWLLAAVALVSGAAWLALRPSAEKGGGSKDPAMERPAAASESDAGPTEPVEPPPVEMAAPAPEHAATAAVESLARAAAAREDRAAADALAARLAAKQRMGPGDVRQAEDLFSRYPDEARGLLEAVLLTAALAERHGRRYAEALALLERAAATSPRSPDVWRALVAVRTDAGDWPGVEAAARTLLDVLPDDAGAVRALAYALVRQDRRREAIEALSALLRGRDDAEARAMLARLERERAVESGFEEQRLAHFHVRYDGEAHEDVGREILRVLDRHYSALRVAFDHEPRAPIPVVLHSRRGYYDATGAPTWSGGEYDHYDGTIRVPIGGLTTSLDPQLDSTLLHEVTHAFVTDLSGGVAPREIQEGLAQWSEGKRGESLLGERGMQALADGRIGGVTGFYLGALVLVEDLIAERGRGGVNDLLAAMARTGDVDAAAREVYGRRFEELKAASAARLRQRHGS
jgi:tetratricopeptide (TPR) repeat protein